MRPTDRFAFSLRMTALVLALALLGVPAALAANDPNECDAPGEAPDVIVGDIGAMARWGVVGEMTGFSFSTNSCNIGTCWLDWIYNTAHHPVIGQTMYRLKDGRFEQIGQSWLKHGFFALSLELCNEGCIPTDGDHLGVNCSDPYSAQLNGDQAGLGPKFEVNASSGVYPYPATGLGMTGDPIYKRLQLRHRDLDPNRNAGARYFAEGQYVTRDDAIAGNQDNNASYREVRVTGTDGEFDMSFLGETQREMPALTAWAAADPTVVLTTTRSDGLFLLAAKTVDLGQGYWSYEYAVQNLNSHRSAGSFEVPLPSGADLQSIGFHDVDYHSGEPYEGDDWTVELQDGFIRWATKTFVEEPNANALRWGTTYNFRFVANVPPGETPGQVKLGQFRPGTPSTLNAFLPVPAPCDLDGVCEPGETCDNCAADCVTPGGSCCGDDTCSTDEDDCQCVADCGPCVQPCTIADECDDGLACNGAEQCVAGFCEAGPELCNGSFCDEESDSCFDCLTSSDCDDNFLCNGIEECVGGACLSGSDPCPGQLCDPVAELCVECVTDTDCDDGGFCNGMEMCLDNECAPATPPCLVGENCDEEADECLGCSVPGECDDGQFCTGVEICLGDRCEDGTPPCTIDQVCDELADRCLDTVPQPAPGDPLHGLTTDERARFDAGRLDFLAEMVAGSGLGPIYNAASCASCHTLAVGSHGNPTVTRFGLFDGLDFDPLTHLGGSLLHTSAVDDACLETLPAEANVSGERLSTPLFGAGLVEAISDTDLQFFELSPPGTVTGRSTMVAPFEDPGTLRVGRYGWKSQLPTVLSGTASEARNEIGLTNRLLPTENAPNGDLDLLAACDDVADPEDGPDATGFDYIDRVGDFVRFLAPPPQTPLRGMTGAVHFSAFGCADCHRPVFTTSASTVLPPVLRSRQIRPYSDYLLHDMGANGELTAEGDAEMGEVRTAPLWGLRLRERLWHDGRVSAGTFDERVRAAIELHDSPGSEAQASAQQFAAAPGSLQEIVLRFLGSLGRREFDSDGDGDVDSVDLDAFLSCFTGPGSSIQADHPCAVFDVDRDQDVDNDDYVVFRSVFEGELGGRVPDGGDVPGTPLTLRLLDGQIELSWGESCAADDQDFNIYQGTLGNFYSHFRRSCGTGGATSALVPLSSSSVYYLVVPGNGLTEGSYGVNSAGVPRPPAQSALACSPQITSECD